MSSTSAHQNQHLTLDRTVWPKTFILKNKISRMFWTKPFPVLDYPQWSTWVQTAVNNNLDKNDNSKIITRNEGNKTQTNIIAFHTQIPQ